MGLRDCQEKTEEPTRGGSKASDPKEISVHTVDIKRPVGLPHDAFHIEPDWLERYLAMKNRGSDGQDVPGQRASAGQHPLYGNFVGEDQEHEFQVDLTRRPPFEVQLQRQGKYWETLGLMVSD